MNLSDALAQSPTVRKAQSRSKYLEDALASIQASGEKIQSWGELAAKLAAMGITQYSSKKANEGLQEALRSEFEGRQSSLLSQLEGLGGPSPMASPAAPAPAPIAPQAPTPQPGAMAQGEGSGSLAAALGAPPPQAPTQPSNLWANLIRQESGGNQAAVSPRGAFGRAQLMPDTAAQIAREMGDPSLAQRARTDPAVNERMGQYYLDQQMQRFGNPAVALAAYNAGPEKAAEWVRRFGMPEPGRELEWAQRITFPETRQYVTNIIGRTGQQGQAPQAAPPAPVEFSPETNQALQGLGIGLGGQPSAPASVPAQEPPPAPSPQGVGGNPQQQPQQQPNPLGPTPGERQLITQLLRSNRPEDYDRANAMIAKIQERMNAPTQYETTTVNGVPAYYNAANPQGGITPFPIPQAAMSQVVSGQEAGVPGAAQGTAFNRSPTGGVTQAWAPPQGYQAAPGGQQSYIPGSSADPTQGQNRLQGLQGIRAEVRPILDDATLLRRSYNSVLEGYRQQSGSGDLALVTGLQKMIDEGVVQRGEFDNQLHAQGLNGTIAGYQQYITSGGVFTPAIRDKIRAAADGIYGRTSQTYRDRVMSYQGMVERAYGPGAFADVVPEETQRAMGWTREPPRQAPQRPSAPSSPPRQQAQPAPAAPQRVRGQVYQTPRGPLRWTGTGWVTP